MSKSRRSSTSLAGLVALLILAGIGYLVYSGLLPTAITAPLATQGINLQTPGAASPAAATLQPPAGGQASGELPAWLQVYFTNPNNNDPNTVDKAVVPVITAASQTIDLTSFDLNLPSVVNALVEASQRGVKVRVVVDEENGTQKLDASDAPDGKDFDALKVLDQAGIPVVNGGRSNGLMHNKMIIVDGKTLFMGSWNMSYNDTYRNNNNLLEITDPTLIANYQAKFNELFVQKRFGTKAQVRAQTPSAALGGVQVENYFSPLDGVMAKLVSYVQAAQKSIHFMAFTYTHADLANAMIERATAGVDVEGVIENRGASQGAFVPLFCAQLPVRLDGNKYTMHHKVIVIDGQVVITGSFNFTKSADEANDDNVLVIHSPAVASIYEQEFQRVYGIGKAAQPGDVACK